MHKTPFFSELRSSFSQWLERLGYAPSSIKGHRRRIHYFLNYLEKQGIRELETVTAKIIQGYQDHLEQLPIQNSTLSGYLSSLRLFDQYLENYGYCPLVTIQLRIIPTIESVKTILHQSEIKAIYEATDHRVLGYKDRAMLALYYGCGLRASEGLNLQVDDLDFKNHLLQVQKSKTYRPRYVPMSEKIQADLQEWLEYGRVLTLKKESPYVLVHSKGKYKCPKIFNTRLKKLVDLAGVSKSITLHGLRHSIATHLLENGMKLEQIRQFLGHQSLEMTQQYTHLIHEEF